jgi:sRNA-binding protein
MHERKRGTIEARQQLAVLREKWPLAFPVLREEVRPPALGAAGEIAAAMGWSVPYTLGVLTPWKMAPAYCQAVLEHDRRIALDGAPAEPVDAEAKELAAKQLEDQGAQRREEGRLARNSEAEAGCANRDASAVARSGACRAAAPARVATGQPIRVALDLSAPPPSTTRKLEVRVHVIVNRSTAANERSRVVIICRIHSYRYAALAA